MYYFDNSATTQPNPEVLETYQKVAQQCFANPSSIHALGVLAQKLLSQAREQVATLLHVQPKEVYFTSSGTEANNWVMQSMVPALNHMRPDAKRILISAIEHPSISEQISWLQAQGFDVQQIPVNADGMIDIMALEQLLDANTLLISTMAINNEVGSVQPLNQMATLLNQYPQIIWHVDGVQAVTTQFEQLTNERIDAVTLSGHKFHAGRGAGILMMKQRVSSQPFLYGGGQESGLRSGTENLASIVATAKALRLAVAAQDEVKLRLQAYRQDIIAALEEHKWIVFAKESASEHIICAAFPTIPGEVLVHAFEAKYVMVSTTSACSSRKHQQHHTLAAMSVPEHLSTSAIRISMASTTTQADVTALIKAIETVTAQFN
ncbi:cysteine desulfurase [Tuanshanicoccus lijuaniae]|uniref:cysteine desulfurase family protein n=1 Tax=Aerococcaceae bacterium zg-1292 TaxID=2774330 RepID=UPI001935853C|nr:cysteine desulfurase [Aerococcaceae bacterium zg-1292]QQA36732.1 cysteine desulfurase [Aerococcaceae bacterium zg-1292]